MVGDQDAETFQLRTPGTASKAMRLLGLTSLPRDLMERPPPQRRASYQEGDKARSALGTISCGFNGLLIEGQTSVSRKFTPLGSCRGEVAEDIFSIAGTESSSENEEYSRAGESIGESGGLFEPDCIRPRFYSHSEIVVAKQRPEISTFTKESSLKLSETDLDDQFIEAVTALTAQFPEPPLSTPSNTPSASKREEGEFTTAPSTSWLDLRFLSSPDPPVTQARCCQKVRRKANWVRRRGVDDAHEAFAARVGHRRRLFSRLPRVERHSPLLRCARELEQPTQTD